MNVRNKARAAGPAGKASGFVAKGQPTKRNAGKTSPQGNGPVSEAVGSGPGPIPDKTPDSEYDPASGKKAGSIADLRRASKLVNERGGIKAAQKGMSRGMSKNNFGKQAKAGMGPMDKKSMKKPRGMAKQSSPEAYDPKDAKMVNNGQTKIGMKKGA